MPTEHRLAPITKLEAVTGQRQHQILVQEACIRQFNVLRGTSRLLETNGYSAEKCADIADILPALDTKHLNISLRQLRKVAQRMKKHPKLSKFADLASKISTIYELRALDAILRADLDSSMISGGVVVLICDVFSRCERKNVVFWSLLKQECEKLHRFAIFKEDF